MGHTLELYSDDLRLYVGFRASQYASPTRKMANNDIALLYRYALRWDHARHGHLLGSQAMGRVSRTHRVDKNTRVLASDGWIWTFRT